MPSFETETDPPASTAPTDLIGEEDKYSYLRVVTQKSTGMVQLSQYCRPAILCSQLFIGYQPIRENRGKMNLKFTFLFE